MGHFAELYKYFSLIGGAAMQGDLLAAEVDAVEKRIVKVRLNKLPRLLKN